MQRGPILQLCGLGKALFEKQVGATAAPIKTLFLDNNSSDVVIFINNERSDYRKAQGDRVKSDAAAPGHFKASRREPDPSIGTRYLPRNSERISGYIICDG